MAHNNQEVEIKYKLSMKEFLVCKKKCREIAKFVKTTFQEDIYYTPVHRNFMAPKYPYEWLSIRKRGGKNILNYKCWYPKGAKKTTHCDEFETEIADKAQIEKIFSTINIKKLVIVNKKRDTFIYKDQFEIVFDAVKNLGYYVEIEALKNLGSVQKTREKIIVFAKELGIDISKVDLRGYPYELLKKEGLVK